LVAQWLATRNDVGAWAPLLQQGYLVDTIEVAGTWSILPDLYETIVRESHALAGVIGLTGHTSHVYADGANLYFTFLAHPQSPDQAEALYREIWSTAMNAALRLGATVSHHHGVGRIRREWMARERREELPWLLQIRKIFDPDGILNRGALWPNF
jgi:alkyldihydroxyacetonephosphate synthase